ncbi:MAG TPA: carboxy terminal-processing peptidase [Chthoniobacteraceae bacterium]|nr:carboxy terminal-processing peptidase [Chthoniobacteraceae bacterium]
MKKFPAFIPSLLAFVVLLPALPLRADDTDPGQISIAVGQLLERDHYTKRKLDADLSKQLLKNYLDSCDYSHLFFTQKDIDAFNDKYATSLSDDILLGNPTAAYEIWDVYTKRVEERVAKVKELLKDGKFTFDSDRTMERDRTKAPWPKDDAEADQIWHDRIEGELLQEKLLPHPIEPALKVLNRRYDQLVKNVHEENRDDVLKRFLDQLAQTYDPHSEYMSKDDFASFSILMKNSLVGIGAVLQSDEGYAKIMDLVEGGPAKMSGKLKVGDRISAVAQGNDDFVDVIDMKLDKVVDMIRGKKGTTVRLKVISAHTADTKVIEIVRDEVKLKEQDAKAELIEMPDVNGQPRRLGWIKLPAFYSDMEHPDQKSTTKDVLALLNRLKQENISGLIMDLRNNGGGSLDEAVNLTGLFVKKGPVVQTKDSNDNVHVSRCRDTEIAWDGPLIVLTNRLSASASEIFTAALQDYGRAVVVGDETTFGKGTVQTVIPIARAIPSFGGIADEYSAGALKLTIQKFYRIAGGSTQLHGVSADVVIPSLWDIPKLYGESALRDPLPYDVVSAATYDKADKQLFIPDLKQRSAARVAANPEFGYVIEDLARIKAKLASNTISLNEKERRAEDAADKERNDKRDAARAKIKAPDEKAYEITLDNVDKPDLQPVKNEVKGPTEDDPNPTDSDDNSGGDATASKKPVIDPQKAEALNILNDLIDLSKSAKTASAATPTPAAQ